MKHTDLKKEIRYFNDMHIQPLIANDDFLRLNMYNFIRNQFKSEAQKLQPIGTGKLDFTNVYNMSNAWDYVLTHMHNKIDIHEIRNINDIISKNNAEDITGGTFRYSFVNVLGQPATEPTRIYDSLDTAIYKMNSTSDTILTRAFNIHYDIITIQPFCDFNKRTARIVMNWFLLQNNYTPILFNHKGDNTEYVASMKSRLNNTDSKAYTVYMCDRMHKTQFMILRMLRARIH